MRILYLLSLMCFCAGTCIQAQSIVHDGLTRTYSVYVPAIYDSTQATPLVFNLHGYSLAGWMQELYGDFRSIADTANFIIVHPDGTRNAIDNQTFWNAGFMPASVDDVGFIEALIDSLSEKYTIDSNRIYSTGMSNGGYMSYELACQSKRFAAIASVTGSMTKKTKNNCTPQRAVPVMQIHGTADSSVMYEGDSLINSLHIDTIVRYWVANNICDTSPRVSIVPDIDRTDGANAVHYVYQNGTNGATVEFFKVFGGGHTWPGASYNIGVTCKDFSASEEIWRFFSQYTLNQFHTTATEKVQNRHVSDLRVYPNPSSSELILSLEELPIKSVRLYDLNGRLRIAKDNINQTNTSIAIQDLPKGLYLLCVNNGITLQKQQVLKQ